MKLRFVLALVAVLLLPAARAGAVTVERVVGDSGVVAWLVRDHSNPIIAVELAFMGSAALDPPGKEGLAHMVASLIDEGSGDLESYAFQKKLEDLAIGLSFSANEDTFHGSLKTLSENRDTAFEMLRMAMTRPRFDEEPVDRIRSQILAGLARDLQNPNVIAQRAWYKTVFPNHPYGTPVNGTPDSIKTIALED
ncbi:MAG: insulinase family protein, partial [Rhodospirillales bacterium]|nr:insulinase family protein [Rhodospirillales bacterium]